MYAEVIFDLELMKNVAVMDKLVEDDARHGVNEHRITTQDNSANSQLCRAFGLKQERAGLHMGVLQLPNKRRPSDRVYNLMKVPKDTRNCPASYDLC